MVKPFYASKSYTIQQTNHLEEKSKPQYQNINGKAPYQQNSKL